MSQESADWSQLFQLLIESSLTCLGGSEKDPAQVWVQGWRTGPLAKFRSCLTSCCHVMPSEDRGAARVTSIDADGAEMRCSW